jgi:RNA polymerase sigma-70 factor, ECF subfamily
MTKEEFICLYEEFFPKVYNSIYYRVNDATTAEDIVSQIFLKILKNKDQYSSEKAKLSTWIYTIAHNCLIDFYRKNDSVENLDILEESFSFEENHQDKIDRELSLNQVMWLLEKLPARTREIISLHIFEEKTFVEIAKIIWIGESGVKMSFARWIEVIKNSLNVLIIVFSFLFR